MCCLEVRLTIADNEASTALATLQRLGVPVTALERYDVYRCDVAPADFERAVEAFRGIETLFNPNKHVLVVRTRDGPLPGEAWIDERPAYVGSDEHHGFLAAARGEGVRVAGRTLPGVRTLERFTGWRLTDESGNPVTPQVVATATETLLCNAAFQRATTA